MKRRDFLKITALGAGALVIPAGVSAVVPATVAGVENLDQGISRTTLKESTQYDMEAGMKVRDVIVEKTNGSKQTVGKFFSLEKDANGFQLGRADFVTPETHPQFFEKTAQGTYNRIYADKVAGAYKKPLLVLAAPYTGDYKTPEGTAYTDGKAVGTDKNDTAFLSKFKGIVHIKGSGGDASDAGCIQILDIEDARNKGMITGAGTEKADLFQSYLVIKDGNINQTINVTGPYKFIVEIVDQRDSSISHGVFDIQADNCAQAVEMLMKRNNGNAKIKHAVILDGGPEYPYHIYEQGKKDNPIGGTGSGYTNLLVLYQRNPS